MNPSRYDWVYYFLYRYRLIQFVLCTYVYVQGSVLGPEEFFEGLGLGLRSFFGAGVVGK